MKLRNKKTGEIWDIGKVLVNDYPCWETLTQICEDWEDVKEPLIKDEKIRKAVRAWAEACCIEIVEITHSRKSILRVMDAISNNDEIVISGEIGQIFEEKVYNITELCGEEE